MVKCRPLYLPQEFSAVFILVLYSPRANSAVVLGLLYDNIQRQETKHPDAMFFVAGDFNHSNMKTILPK